MCSLTASLQPHLHLPQGCGGYPLGSHSQRSMLDCARCGLLRAVLALMRSLLHAKTLHSTRRRRRWEIEKKAWEEGGGRGAIFDRSGRYVITGSDDRLVKIWSMETAFCLASCRGHEWRLPDGLPISVLRGHTGAVTAIVFSPRPAAIYQLLSSSDDGTCRIWDARYSQSTPRVYIPKPPDAIPGKGSQPSSSSIQQGNQILCCAYNANGTVFVTGSSDTYARVWNACKPTSEDAEQPNHEMDLLSGHENDVNYVQFSGCAVPSRSAAADNSKEDNLPKFKNSWLAANPVSFFVNVSLVDLL
ncbi:hypothetical protein Taro_023465 [Colocasia esculenta]|uniref:Uncharacterized protein n=1 Tax=Colocasia esculenta TaxID=4460 RepID=A0A843V4R3_COLES|nr:hypothetical protein [Colocasia esculenta]